MLTDWIPTATSIWAAGFEAWREAIEIKPLEATSAGSPFGYGSVEAVKGCGRVSILLFSITFTYLQLSKNMTAEETADFQRHLGIIHGAFGIFHRKHVCRHLYRHRCVAFQKSNMSKIER